jgi:hypothetical protein
MSSISNATGALDFRTGIERVSYAATGQSDPTLPLNRPALSEQAVPSKLAGLFQDQAVDLFLADSLRPKEMTSALLGSASYGEHLLKMRGRLRDLRAALPTELVELITPAVLKEAASKLAKCVAPGISLWISELLAPLCQGSCAPFLLHVVRCLATAAVEGDARYFVYCTRLVPLMEEVEVPPDELSQAPQIVQKLRPIVIGA